MQRLVPRLHFPGGLRRLRRQEFGIRGRQALDPGGVVPPRRGPAANVSEDRQAQPLSKGRWGTMIGPLPSLLPPRTSRLCVEVCLVAILISLAAPGIASDHNNLEAG